MPAVLAVVLTLGSIVWSTDLLRQVGILLYDEQFLAGTLAIAFPLVFLSARIVKSLPKTPIPWYDYLLAVLGFGAGAFVAVNYPVLAELVWAPEPDGLIAGGLILVLVIEGLRRTVGLVLTFLAIAFVAMALLGHLIPPPLQGNEMNWRNLVYFLGWDPTAIFGVPLKIVSSIVITFVFFGQVLSRSGGSLFFTEIATVLVGRFRGGQAKIAVTASGFFGSISGSVVSNVVTTGVVTIPLMRSGGYSAVHAGAIEAVASTGGQLMPPVMGAAAFLMAEFLEIPYTEVVLAALIPAILYYVALFVLADLEAARSGIRPLSRAEIPKAMPILKDGWFFPVPFAILVVALFWWNWSPEESALLATVSIILICMAFGYKGQRFTLSDVVASFRDTGFAVLDIIMIAGAAGIVIGTLNVTGIGFGLSLLLVELGSGNLILLLMTSAVICIVLGMGMPTVGVYLLLATLVAPALIEVGIDPIAAHLFILYFGMMSMITPPVAVAAFAAATLTGADAMRTGFAAMRFGWFAYLVPFLFVFTPELTMKGDTVRIVLTAISAALGVWLVSVAIMGYFVRHVGIASRLVFFVAGMAFLLPDVAIPGLPVAPPIVGLILAIPLGAFEFLTMRKVKSA